MEENTEDQKAKFNPLYGIGIGAVIIVLGAGFFIMGHKNDTKSNNTTMSQATTTKTKPTTKNEVAGASTKSTDEVKIVQVEAGSFYYKPNEIKVKKGQKVKIVMNSVSMMHDFNIDELNVRMPVTPKGTTGTVEFTADKAGTFEYYCSVGQHRKMGQVGKIIVE
jgi:heme/copper-type cytochrome/quinol oxidase subunit 2